MNLKVDMIRIFRLPSIVSILLTVMLIFPAASKNTADGFIRDIGQKTISSLTDENISSEDRERLFREIFNRYFDVRLIARFSLGVHWRRASDAQREEYVTLFEKFVVKSYAARFSEYTGTGFKVGETKEIRGGDKLVASEIELPDGRVVPVHWRIRIKSTEQIVDVLIEGVSMAITQRDEFASIINQSGGSLDGLLIALRERIND